MFISRVTLGDSKRRSPATIWTRAEWLPAAMHARATDPSTKLRCECVYKLPRTPLLCSSAAQTGGLVKADCG
jgi:hypothetical protein